jgi:hypothetical protein
VGGEGRISSSSVPKTHPTFLFKVIFNTSFLATRLSWILNPRHRIPRPARGSEQYKKRHKLVCSAAQPAKNCLIKNYWLTPNKYESYLCYLTLLLNFNESHHVIEKLLLLLLLYSYTFFLIFGWNIYQWTIVIKVKQTYIRAYVHT